jgi:hypothetical protein
MSSNARSVKPLAQPDVILQLAEILTDHKLEMLAIQEIIFTLIHIKIFTTVLVPSSRGFQGSTLLMHDFFFWKKNSRLSGLLRQIQGVKCQIIDVFSEFSIFSATASCIHHSSPKDSIRSW